MRFLANENFPLASVRRLREEGHDVFAIAESMPASKDEKVLSLAVQEGRILLTFDRDYGKLIYRRGLAAPVGIVYFRCVPTTPSQPAEVVLDLAQVVNFENRYTVVEPHQIRQRLLR